MPENGSISGRSPEALTPLQRRSDGKAAGEDETCARSYPMPVDETARLKALYELELLDTAPEEEFDRITRLARILFGTRIAALSLVDEKRQFFKAISGLHAEGTAREDAFCAYTVLEDKAFVVLDAQKDERFDDNPLVTGDVGIRFYAGAPLHSASGARVGSLCIIDNKPRENWSAVETSLLKDLAALVSNALRSRQEQKEHVQVREDLCKLRSLSAQQELVDKLTGLPDRRVLESIITHAKSAADESDRFIGLLYLDIDGFADLNEKFQEEGGDEVLKVLAQRLRNSFRTNDYVLRIAGDQFLVILQGLQMTNGIERPVRNLFLATGRPIPWKDRVISVRVSVGVSFYPHCGSSTVELLLDAKKAMLIAKETGGNRCAIHLPGKETTYLSASH